MTRPEKMYEFALTASSEMRGWVLDNAEYTEETHRFEETDFRLTRSPNRLTVRVPKILLVIESESTIRFFLELLNRIEDGEKRRWSRNVRMTVDSVGEMPWDNRADIEDALERAEYAFEQCFGGRVKATFKLEARAE